MTGSSLLGEKVTINGEEWTVDSTATFSDQYVYLTKPSTKDGEPIPGREDLICRRAGDVRAAIAIEKSRQ